MSKYWLRLMYPVLEENRSNWLPFSGCASSYRRQKNVLCSPGLPGVALQSSNISGMGKHWRQSLTKGQRSLPLMAYCWPMNEQPRDVNHPYLVWRNEWCRLRWNKQWEISVEYMKILTLAGDVHSMRTVWAVALLLSCMCSRFCPWAMLPIYFPVW